MRRRLKRVWITEETDKLLGRISEELGIFKTKAVERAAKKLEEEIGIR